MFTDSRNPLHNEIIDRRDTLKERIVDLMETPESIKNQEDILFVERYDNYVSFFFYSPAENRRYKTVPLGCDLAEESRHIVFCYERNWEEEGYNQSAPVIQLKDGRQIECGIINLDDLEDAEREKMEAGFNQVQKILLKNRILNLMKNPETIVEQQQDILFAEKYDNYLAFYLHCPIQSRKYQTAPIAKDFTDYHEIPEEIKNLLFRCERSWEDEEHTFCAPVIELKDGKQVECAILDLTDFEEAERAIIEAGFNQVQRIVVEENATMLQ